MSEIEFTDRYKALGIPYPDPETMCKGHCEGTGHIPIGPNDPNPEFKKRWEILEAKKHEPDGWHFIVCPDCEGSGKAAGKDGNCRKCGKPYLECKDAYK